MKPKNLVDKKPKKVPDTIERHHGDCTNFMDKYGYKKGFKGLDFKESIELLSILAVREKASEKIEDNMSSIIYGYTNKYTEKSLSDYEYIYNKFQTQFESEFQQLSLSIDSVIYNHLDEKDNLDSVQDYCVKLLENVGSKTSSIANYLTLFVACRKILNRDSGENIRSIIDNEYINSIYNTCLSYYSLDREEIEDLDKNKSELKAFSYFKILIEDSSRIESDFFHLCYYRSESIIERERHCDLNNPRELHISIAETIIKCCCENINCIKSDEKELKEKYSRLYLHQCRAIRMRINSSHKESARKYFLASNVAETFRSNRRAKLEIQGYREVAKDYGDYDKRISIYNNALEYFKNSRRDTDIVDKILNDIKLEIEISKSVVLFDEYKELEDKLRRKVSDAKSIEDGSEKFMNEDVETLDEILNFID